MATVSVQGFKHQIQLTRLHFCRFLCSKTSEKSSATREAPTSLGGNSWTILSNSSWLPFVLQTSLRHLVSHILSLAGHRGVSLFYSIHRQLHHIVRLHRSSPVGRLLDREEHHRTDTGGPPMVELHRRWGKFKLDLWVEGKDSELKLRKFLFDDSSTGQVAGAPTQCTRS